MQGARRSPEASNCDGHHPHCNSETPEKRHNQTMAESDRPVGVGVFVRRANSALGRLASRVATQQKLLAAVRACLPADLRAHCKAVALQRTQLTVFTQSSAWATRLRYAVGPMATELAKRDMPAPEKIHVRVLAPLETVEIRVKSCRNGLSSESAQVLLTTANTVSDPALAAALRKLAAHRRRSSG